VNLTRVAGLRLLVRSINKMTKHVESVARDIRELLVGVKTGSHTVEFDSPEFLGKFGLQTAKAFRKTLSSEEKVRPPNTFYASEIGQRCYRQLWYKYHQPERGEPASASMAMKYLYGGIIEEVVLRLAELSGHTVSCEQHLVEVKQDGIIIRGRLDAVIDNEAVVDVKSTSSYGFKDFKMGLGGEKFGYKTQLGFYQTYWNVPAVREAPKKGFLVVDKQLGHIEYCPETSTVNFGPIFGGLKEIVTNNIKPPFERLATVTEGSNQKLGMECNYCSYKQECWKESNGGKGLRAFQYAGKIMWLTEVKKEPKVPEITDKILTGGDDGA